MKPANLKPGPFAYHAQLVAHAIRYGHAAYSIASEPRVEYTGHHGTSGLQGHSIGDEYPFVIYKVGHSDGPDKWAVLDGSTGHYYPERFDTYPQAQAFIKELNNAL